MTQFLPPNLLALFAPRDPIPYLPPVSKLPHEKKNGGYIGVGGFLKYFEDPKDTPPPVRVETREERLERRRRERAEQVAYKLEQEIAVWDPAGILNVTADPFKTLFVARINYDTSESKLRREFEVYGPVKKIVVIHNTINGKPRGYAFIEYEHERDMHSAYKHADGKKIDGRRVLVDVERARTVKGWLPRRLGGGLGGTRRGGPDVNIKHSGREDNEENENDIVWNERGRILDALIETEIVIVWTGSVEDREIVKEEQEVGRVIENVDEVAIVYLIQTLKRFRETKGPGIGEIVIVNVIVNGIVRGDVLEVPIVIVTETVRETSVIVIVNVEIGKIGVIVKRKIRKKSELKRNLWMITLIIAILSQRLDLTLPL